MTRLIPAALLLLSTMAQAQEDPYIWLEDVTGDKPMAWVKEQNAHSQPLLESKPGFKALHERLVAIYNSRERIPGVKKLGSGFHSVSSSPTTARM